MATLTSIASSPSSFLVKRPTPPPPNKPNSIQSYLNNSNNSGKTISELKNSIYLTSTSASPSSSTSTVSPSPKLNTSTGLAQLLINGPVTNSLNGVRSKRDELDSYQYQENQVTTTIKPKLFQSIGYNQAGSNLMPPSSSSMSSSSNISNNNNSNIIMTNSNVINNNNINSNYNQLKLAASTSPTLISDSNVVSSTSSTGNDLNNKSK
jgi:hypothetical protein